jgi:hypothetical protein
VDRVPTTYRLEEINHQRMAEEKLGGLLHLPELSAHSLRCGMATSAHRAAIKRQGGWKRDETVDI